MMGERLVMQESLFHAFQHEDHVPCDHLLRRINRFVNCSALREHLAGFYSSTGRPSNGLLAPEQSEPRIWPLMSSPASQSRTFPKGPKQRDRNPRCNLKSPPSIALRPKYLE